MKINIKKSLFIKYFLLVNLVFFVILADESAVSIVDLPSQKGLKNKIVFKAEEFEIDGRKNVIYARGGVKIFEEKMLISGKEAVYYQNKNIAEVQGGVNLTYRNFKVKCQNAKLYGYGDKKIEALNGVVFNYQNVNGKSNIAVFYPRDNKVTLHGNASAVSRGDLLQGEEIIVYLEEKRIISRGNTSITITKK